MKNVGVVWKKELTDAVRDPRTFFLMIIFPLVLNPLLIAGMGLMTRSQQREIALAAAPPDIGIPPQDAQTGTGRIDEHAVEATRERQRPQQIRLHEPHVHGAACRDRASQQLHAPVPHVARDQQPGIPHRGREGDGLPAG